MKPKKQSEETKTAKPEPVVLGEHKIVQLPETLVTFADLQDKVRELIDAVNSR